jgi:hypothetical protein
LPCGFSPVHLIQFSPALFVCGEVVAEGAVKSPREGVIVNEILEDDAGELQLRFYAYLGLVGITPRSEQERQTQALTDSEDRDYKAALLSTLVQTRTLAEEGSFDRWSPDLLFDAQSDLRHES